MGTHIAFVAYTTRAVDAAGVRRAFAAALAEIQRIEALMTTWRGEPVLLSLYPLDDLRGALRGTPAERGDAAGVERLLAGTPGTSG